MREVKEIQAELDKTLGEYERASKAGDDKEVERLGAKILDLETEREWVML